MDGGVQIYNYMYGQEQMYSTEDMGIEAKTTTWESACEWQTGIELCYYVCL